MEIGNLKLNSKILLAPMAGVNDVGFRALAKYYGADISYTEMVSAKGLIYGEGKALTTPLNPEFVKQNPEIAKNKSSWLLFTEDIEKIKAVQIFGSDPKFMVKACQLDLLKKFNIIDINMGCPAPKIVKNGEGSALMDNIDIAKQIIERCVEESDKIITVKFRKGYRKNNAVEFAKMCEKAGAKAISVHARFANQGYSGIVDYSLMKEIVNAVNIPVIGSGDITDIESLKKMLDTGVEGVMVGRASFGNPVIFKELNEYINGIKKQPIENFILKDDFFKDVLTENDLENLKKNEKYINYINAKKHISILRKYYSENFLIKYMRKHMLWYTNGIRCNSELKQKLATSENLNDSLNILKKIIIN